MNTKVVILIFICLLLVSCAPETPTLESQVEVIEVATETPSDEATVIQEPVVTEEPIAIKISTETPTATPLACVTLLSPVNGEEIPTVGKVTFSWTPMDEAEKYVLNVILPSGHIVPFETDQTFRDRYMEAFVAGGEYQWQVIAKDKDGSEICVSEIAKFDKPAYQSSSSDSGKDGSGNGSGSNGGPGGGGSTCGSGDPSCVP